MADAEAICEAVMRPNMHFVAIKSADQQAVLMLHRARDILVRQRTMLINALRAHLAELGIVAARGPHKLCFLLSELTNGDCEIQAWHRESAVSQKLATIPGIGPLTATALAATIVDPSQFRSARQFAA